MQFLYEFLKAPGTEPTRPWLRITLAGPRHWVDLPMLLDLGADVSSVPLFVAQPLGVDLSAEPIQVKGIGGYEWAIPSTVTIILRGVEGQCEIPHAPLNVTLGLDEAGRPSLRNTPANTWALLGREPVLEMFDLLYTHSRRYALLIGPDETHPLQPRTYAPTAVPAALEELAENELVPSS